MHEFSIALALKELVAQRAPPGLVVRSVSVRAGAMRAIEPEAMRWAWRAAVQGTALDGSQLRLTNLPWSLRCGGCGRTWQAADPSQPCACGHASVYPSEDSSDDELTLVSIEVDDPPVSVVSSRGPAVLKSE